MDVLSFKNQNLHFDPEWLRNIFLGQSLAPVPVPRIIDSITLPLLSFLQLLPNIISIPTSLSPITTLPFARSILIVALNPFIWNIFGRLEHNTGAISTIFFGRQSGVYALSLWIFCFSNYRNALVHELVTSSPRVDWMSGPIFKATSIILGIIGVIIAGAAYIRLGITMTYLGDYFGFLMDKKETRFPFNIMKHPMYDGIAMVFLAKALW
eukprot:Plantae.Rhodophyta-Hildenbrandia_rubra.ctg8995.p1 GENE.Plantae.Rhodophyta-Hildenbrandia_rubra.ctg8995~~Plantae.Rhodophyta-Hildenbrandia_rubra.ctg8995.p1  ORF type:complete len:210 (+),score=6.40 Plantae.Rhodophyta-Hildenbrandia_rubra.ctg8995:274-903(+)